MRKVGLCPVVSKILRDLFAMPSRRTASPPSMCRGVQNRSANFLVRCPCPYQATGHVGFTAAFCALTGRSGSSAVRSPAPADVRQLVMFGFTAAFLTSSRRTASPPSMCRGVQNRSANFLVRRPCPYQATGRVGFTAAFCAPTGRSGSSAVRSPAPADVRQTMATHETTGILNCDRNAITSFTGYFPLRAVD
jgi:hypothetical protein